MTVSLKRLGVSLLAASLLIIIASSFAFPSSAAVWLRAAPAALLRPIPAPRIAFARLGPAPNASAAVYDLIVGIPTVLRAHNVGFSYLQSTLDKLIPALRAADRPPLRVAIAVLLTDHPNSTERRTVEHFVTHAYEREIRDDLLHLLAPDVSFYARLDEPCGLRRNFNDSLQRVVWRTKLVIDGALIAAYARDRSRFYLHLEDDVAPRKPAEWLRTVAHYVESHTAWLGEAVSFASHCKGTEMSYLWRVHGRMAGMFGLLMRASLVEGFVPHALANADTEPLDWLFSAYLHFTLGVESLLHCAEHLFYHTGRASTKHLVMDAPQPAPRGRRRREWHTRTRTRTHTARTTVDLEPEAWGDCDALRVWPLPRTLSSGRATLALHTDARVTLSHPLPALRQVATQLSELLNGTDCRPAPPRAHITEIRIELDEPIVSGSEFYTITADAPRLLLRARSEAGVRHAWHTLRQLVRPATYSNCHMLMGAPLHLADEPRYTHRGVSIDSVQSRLSPGLISNVLRAMAAAKLNALHWRIHDEVSIRAAMDRLSAAPGSADPAVAISDAENAALAGTPYTAEEVRALLREAERAGVRVIPELPLPALRPAAECEPAANYTQTHAHAHTCTREVWAFAVGADLARADDDARIAAYVRHLRALFSPHAHESTSPFYIGFGRTLRTLPCAAHPRLSLHAPATLAAAYAAHFTGLCNLLNLTAFAPLVASVNASAAYAVVAADANALSVLPPNARMVSAQGWSLGVGCLTWRECYDANFPLSEFSDRGDLIIGGLVSAFGMAEAHFSGRRVWLRILAAAELMWGGAANDPDAHLASRVRLLCSRLALDGLMSPADCDTDAPEAARTEVWNAAAEGDACAVL